MTSIILVVLCSLWSAGCVIAPLYGTYYMWSDGDTLPALLMGSLVFPVGCLLAVLPWVLVAESKDPHISLNKTEWVCMDSHVVPITTYVKSGSVMVPMTTYQRICDEYRRK